MTSPPSPLLAGEGGRIINIKFIRALKRLITPPSLQGKGVGGLGHTIYKKAGFREIEID